MTGLDRLHGIAEDVGRTVWLRDLGAALSDTADGIEGGPRDISGYESDVLAWVEKNGGLEAVRERLMPEGMEWLVDAWPRFEDDTPVRVGDEVCSGGRAFIVDHVVLFSNGESTVCAEADMDSGKVRDYVRVRPSYRLKRPAPPVLDADGVEIRVGDTVWHVETGEQCKVVEVDSRSVSVDFRVDGDGTKHTGSILPANLTHRAPVLAADGRPLREGETVWSVRTGERFVVSSTSFKDPETGEPLFVSDKEGSIPIPAKWVTHERPVADTWERLEEDCAKSDVDYCAERGLLDPSCDTVEGEGSTRHCTDCGCTCGEKMARDLVRRARALAERGQ